jgi:two-component system, chemotaxis family, chemotaxis protein CheY
MKALVVDDSRAMRAIIAGMLRENGFEVAEAGDGEAALAGLRAAAADLVVLDWHLPGMTGPEVVRAIRAEPAWSAVRVLMITTEVDPDRVREALDAGAQEYLMKPFTADHIRDKLTLLGLRAP